MQINWSDISYLQRGNKRQQQVYHIIQTLEIFGQPLPVTEQNAYLHLLVEARLLSIGGERAKREIRRLKRAGLKTEPAFTRYFRFEGKPYQTLLQLSMLKDSELQALINANYSVGKENIV